MSIFDDFKNLFTKEEKVVETESLYVLNRLISLTEYFPFVNLVNRYAGKIDDFFLLKFYNQVIKKQKKRYVPYPKRLKFDKESIEKICAQNNCSFKHAHQISKILQKKNESL